MLTITNEDNMVLMSRYPDKHFDLAIADPPFGLSDTKKNKFRRNKNTHSYKNNSIPDVEYFKELERVSKRSIIWGCQYLMPYLNPLGSFIVWHKKAVPELHNMSSCDIAWHSKREKIKHFEAHWCGAVKVDNEKTIHIHQKPVALYRWLLQNFAATTDKILDTHLGSGSIAIACHDYGYDLTACELDKDYYEAAMKRINNHIAQTKLF